MFLDRLLAGRLLFLGASKGVSKALSAADARAERIFVQGMAGADIEDKSQTKKSPREGGQTVVS
ncbi:hypothetical protein [Pseudomonas sp. TMB3-21]